MTARTPEAADRQKERERIRGQWRSAYRWYIKLLAVRGVITDEERKAIRV